MSHVKATDILLHLVLVPVRNGVPAGLNSPGSGVIASVSRMPMTNPPQIKF